MRKMANCDWHLWKTEDDPPELAELTAGQGCPLCRLAECRDAAIKLANSGMPGWDWPAAEAATERYAAAVIAHRSKLSAAEAKEYDQQNVKLFLESLTVNH